MKRRDGQQVLVALIVALLIAVSAGGMVLVAQIPPGGGVLVMGFLYWLRSALILWNRHRAGALLVDLGPASVVSLGKRWTLLLIALGAAFCYAITPAFALAFLSFMPLASFVESASRMQLRERGVIDGTRFVPWRRIAVYAFEDDYEVVDDLAVRSSTTLMIEYHQYWGLRWRLGLPYPEQAFADVTRVMAAYGPLKGRRRLSPIGPPIEGGDTEMEME